MWKRYTVGNGCIGWIKTAGEDECALDGCGNVRQERSKYCSRGCCVKNAHKRAKSRKEAHMAQWESAV